MPRDLNSYVIHNVVLGMYLILKNKMFIQGELGIVLTYAGNSNKIKNIGNRYTSRLEEQR